MDIIDYDILKLDEKLLIFVSVEEFPRENTKLSYKTIHNMIYPVSDGYCVSDKKGVGLAIRSTLEECVAFLNSELGLKYNLKADLDLDKVQEIKN
jgi:hypothetical protein